MTKTEILEGIKNVIVEIEGTEDYVAFLDKEIAANKAKQQKARERREEKKAAGDVLTDAVYEVIVNAAGAITPQEIADALVADFEDVTKNKVTYRATQLIKEGKVFKTQVKDEDGHKAVAYTLENAEEVEDAE